MRSLESVVATISKFVSIVHERLLWLDTNLPTRYSIRPPGEPPHAEGFTHTIEFGDGFSYGFYDERDAMWFKLACVDLMANLDHCELDALHRLRLTS